MHKRVCFLSALAQPQTRLTWHWAIYIQHRIRLLPKYSEENCRGKRLTLCLSVLSSFLSLWHPMSHALHFTSYAKWGRAQWEKKNHRDKQMLCEALAGATLMLASTVKLCLVINKYRFLPLHSWINSTMFSLITCWKFCIQPGVQVWDSLENHCLLNPLDQWFLNTHQVMSDLSLTCKDVLVRWCLGSKVT